MKSRTTEFIQIKKDYNNTMNTDMPAKQITQMKWKIPRKT